MDRILLREQALPQPHHPQSVKRSLDSLDTGKCLKPRFQIFSGLIPRQSVAAL
ncbi:MAG: hypothetical protein HN758_12325 [Verrucomicrobia bacterium]|jgi:hypothetical protein|nr:hypothetical protein [Verrucomicrobiota bacterium]MBT4275018.1 hypothetical protein [Verrucomicrobiota bacterium]MBT5063506.1 hypothetical protein [Verrucomicrobiota bacterium]MBT5477600.1 hypothetical protein [Verrucomicrobiota bacterium]MBT6237776.1 hypothetical protein [Verrucomicrobiota bacterium]